MDQKKSSCRQVDSQEPEKSSPRRSMCDKRLGVPLGVFIANTLTTSRSTATSSLTQLKGERSLSKSAYVLLHQT